MEQGKGIIGLRINGMKVNAKFQLKGLNQAQVSMLITHLEIVRENLLQRYKKGIMENQSE